MTIAFAGQIRRRILDLLLMESDFRCLMPVAVDVSRLESVWMDEGCHRLLTVAVVFVPCEAGA
jgi:hypothetical protein